MAEYSRTAKGSFTSTGAAKSIFLPFTPDTIRMWNYTSYATPAQHGIPNAYWDSSMYQGSAMVELFNATPVLTTDIIVSVGGFSTFSAGQLLMFGPKVQIVAAAKSATSVGGTTFTVSSNPFLAGDVIQFEGLYQTSSTGMPQLCGPPMVISSVTATTFVIGWNTNGSNYTSLSASPAGAYVRKILYPFLYAPGVSVISAITLGTTTTIETTSPHNLVTGQQIAFRIPTAWGTTQLNSLPNSNVPGSPVYYYVTSVTSQTTFVCNANTVSATAFNTNQPVSSIPGLDFAQVVAVGDINSGGDVYSGGALYPSPAFPTYPPSISTINGPAIRGSFINNTAQGFVIGAGSTSGDASSVLVGASGDVIYWEAQLHDISI